MAGAAVDVIETELLEEPPLTVVTEPKPQAPPPVKPDSGRRRGLTAGTRTTLWMLLAFGLLALWIVSYARVFSGIEQNASQRGLYDQFREELAKATAPIGGVIEPGSPIAILDAPAAGINGQIVVEGTSADVMRDGPGHRRDTALPGQPGTSLIYGRAVTFGGTFGSIGDLRLGFPITVTTGQGAFTYKVTAVRRPGDPLPPPLGEGEGRLTLVTAEGEGYLQGWAAQAPLLVDAELVGKGADVPVGRLTVIPESEAVLVGTTATLVALVLWLQLLVVVVAAWAWAAMRWDKWQAWLVAVPAFAAALWGATSAAFALLPNLL